MIRLWLIPLLIACWSGAAVAETRPLMRPEVIQEATAARPSLGPLRSERPLMRGTPGQPKAQNLGQIITQALGITPPAESDPLMLAVLRSDRPKVRPQVVVQQSKSYASGTVCNSPKIKGKRIPAITSGVSGCGVAQAVQITEVAGVKLSQAAKVECATAQALETWIETGVRPLVGRTGGGLAGLQVAAHYSCRTRNNQAGAKVSEHGKGRAIDISGLILADGSKISVLQGWNGSRREREIMRGAHKAACGPFGTVLGPKADRFHQDHLHFDVAKHRSGSYCR